MAEAMGYDTITLKPDMERFCWEYVRNGGNATRAYLTINPEATPNGARKYASKLITTREDIPLRIEQIRAEIAREWKSKIRDFHGRSLEFDPADAFASGGGRISIADMPVELRKLCTLEARIVEGSVVYIPVFPDKVKAAGELAKMMGMITDKKELSGTVTTIGETVHVYLPENNRDLPEAAEGASGSVPLHLG